MSLLSNQKAVIKGLKGVQGTAVACAAFKKVGGLTWSNPQNQHKSPIRILHLCFHAKGSNKRLFYCYIGPYVGPFYQTKVGLNFCMQLYFKFCGLILMWKHKKIEKNSTTSLHTDFIINTLCIFVSAR